ncbi:MAG: hypothetical protein QOH61_1038 [Chloroflexota bacterium]|jgi:hypothetical protein|nr:hypothetical protein [Chloroflexota bacterium]
MNVSILLRLVADALGEGRVAGHAEVVDTGEIAAFKDQEEMLAILQRASLGVTARTILPQVVEEAPEAAT